MRRALSLATAAALALHGCSSDGGSTAGDAGPLAPTRTASIGYNVIAVAGHGDRIAALHYDADAILRLVRRDPTAPAEFVDLGDLSVAGSSVNPLDDLVVTEDWVTLCSGGTTAVVSLTTPAPERVATFGTGVGTRALASGRWLLYVQDRMLSVRDLESPGTGFPQAGSAMDAGAPVTGLAAALDGFYVFTSAGFGHVSMAGDVPAYRHVASDTLRLFSKAYLHGTKLYVGGPSSYLGKIRVARIDVSTPAAPAVEALADVEASWGDFAYDGAGAYAVLGQTFDHGVYRLTVLRESGGTIVPGAARDLPVLRGETSIAHASHGMLYTPYHPSVYVSTASDLAVWALP